MRIDEGHVGVTEGIFLLFAVFSTMLYLQFPAYLVEAGGPAAWQVGLIVTVVALLMFCPIAWLAARFPGQRLTAISAEVVGPWVGSLLTLVVCLWLLGSGAVTLRNCTEMFITSILPHTPPSVLMGSILLVVLYGAYLGIEPLSRTTQLLFPLIIAGSLLIIISSLPHADVSFLFPILGHAPLMTLWGGIYYTGMAAEVILLLVAGASFRQPGTVGRIGFWALLLIGITATITAAILVMVYGAPDAARVPLPLFNLARVVHLGRFFQRLEAVIVMFWFFAACVRLTALIYGAAVSLTDALGLPHYRPLLWPVGVLIMALAFIPKDFMTVFRVERDLIRPLGWVILAIPMLLWLVALARGKGGESHVA